MTHSWIDTVGEKPIAATLRRRLGRRAIVLGDRSVAGTIDQIVVAPSGIWIIEAKDCLGRLEIRMAPGEAGAEQRLYCGEQDRTELIERMGAQVRAVTRALDSIGMGVVPIRPALCFSKPRLSGSGVSGLIGGVWVGNSRELVRAIRWGSVLSSGQIQTASTGLAQDLPAATAA